MASFNLEKFRQERDKAIQRARQIYSSAPHPKTIPTKVNDKSAPHRGGCGCGRAK